MFKVGDIVKIINPGETYSTYETWIDEHCSQYKKFFELGKRPTKNECGEIKYIGYHNVFHKKNISSNPNDNFKSSICYWY